VSTIRVLLADDHQLVRAGIRALLESLEDVQVVGEADNGRTALELIRTTHPHAVLLDIAMSEMNGLEAARRVHEEFPDVRVLMLSMHANEEYVRQAMRAGAAGYLLKDAAPTELALALRAILRGETYLSPAVSTGVIADSLHGGFDTPSTYERLSPRQREVLQLIAEGKSTKDIARGLKLSIKTVETHRAALMRALDIHDVAGLVRYAVRLGLVTVDK
jgi:DNA-binding NarL/FixJ family response regulator